MLTAGGNSVLLVSGRLDLTMGGPGISQFSSRPGAQLTPILDYSQYDWDSPGAGRRSIYRVVWRGIQDPLLEPLDFPDLGLLAPVRGFSASPMQSLTMLNNRFVLHHVQHWLAEFVRLNRMGPLRRDWRLNLPGRDSQMPTSTSCWKLFGNSRGWKPYVDCLSTAMNFCLWIEVISI